MRHNGMYGEGLGAEIAAQAGDCDEYAGAALRSAAAIGDSKAVGEDVYSVTIFANELSRDGMSVDLDGMDFANYEKNPVVLYAHDHVGRTESGGLPIGRTLRLARTRDGHIRANFEFLAGDTFSERVRNAWEKGFLRGASIGWRPVETRPYGRGLRAVKSELLEWSIVAVPADPDALRDVYLRVVRAMLNPPPDGLEVGETVIFDHRVESPSPQPSPVEEEGELELVETRRLLTDFRERVSVCTVIYGIGVMDMIRLMQVRQAMGITLTQSREREFPLYMKGMTKVSG